MKYAAIGGVALVVLGLLGTAAWQLWGPGRGSMAGPPDRFKLKCAACQAEWDMPKAQYTEHFQKLQQPTAGSPAVDCPKCGQKACAYVMAQCPACQKYYLSPAVTDPGGVMSGRVRIVCPHCQADIQKYYNSR